MDSINLTNEKGQGKDFSSTLRNLILNGEIQEPLIFKGIHKNWDPTLWDLDQWGQLFVCNGKEKKLTCRVGQQIYQYNEPQFEADTETKTISWSELQSWSDQPCNSNSWAYYDYKNIIEVFDKVHFEAFEWSKLGFPDRSGELGNVWIGTKGSYTPCHFDTYGCNLVSQIRGRKEWTLFPPSDTNYLHPTRIPYEESSVYSQINMLCPFETHLKDLAHCNPVNIILEPGDVLYVPPKWWHFVQSQDFTISVNTWIQLPQDRKSRVEEALVRFLVGSIVSLATPDTTFDILNPSEEDLTEASEDDLERILQTSADDFLSNCDSGSQTDEDRILPLTSNCATIDNHYESEPKKSKHSTVVEDFLSLYPDTAEKLKPYFFNPNSTTLHRQDTQQFKSARKNKNKYLSHFINAIGYPSILKEISEKFLANVLNERTELN